MERGDHVRPGRCPSLPKTAPRSNDRPSSRRFPQESHGWLAGRVEAGFVRTCSPAPGDAGSAAIPLRGEGHRRPPLISARRWRRRDPRNFTMICRSAASQSPLCVRKFYTMTRTWSTTSPAPACTANWYTSGSSPCHLCRFGGGVFWDSDFPWSFSGVQQDRSN